MNENPNMDPAQEKADELLTKLLHLKNYETPDPSRMTRNKQNIMRQVRQSQANKRKPLLDLLEVNIPWFFSEPKFGIAAVFVAFLALQYVGINARHTRTSTTGVYSSHTSLVDTEYAPVTNIESNRYPTLPRDYQLFGQPEGDQTVLPAGFELKK